MGRIFFIWAVATVLQVQAGEITRGERIGSKGRRVDFDAGRDTECRKRFANRGIDVPGGAIAASEEQEVYVQPPHLSGGVPGILRGRCARLNGADGRGHETTRPGCILPHLAGIGDQLKVVDGLESFEGLDRPVQRVGDSAQFKGSLLDLQAIAALEPDPAPDPGHRVDDQA